MKTRAFTLAFLFSSLFTAAAFGAGQKITISGYLEDAATTPPLALNGTFLWEVCFYESETSTQTIAQPTTGTVKVKRGVLSIMLAPPENIHEYFLLWYSVAIDTDGDGLDGKDLFDERTMFSAVPYSLSGPVSEFYVTHGGGQKSNSSIVEANRLFVAPFITPAGGVSFSKMSMRIDNNAGPEFSNCSFGIYDRNGKIVATSGLKAVALNFDGIVEATCGETRLAPSRMYYTAYSADHRGPTTYSGLVPPVPNCGYIPDATANGLIPESFDKSQIVPAYHLAPCIALYN